MLLLYRARDAFAARGCTAKRDFDIDRHVGTANEHTKHIIEPISRIQPLPIRNCNEGRGLQLSNWCLKLVKLQPREMLFLSSACDNGAIAFKDERLGQPIDLTTLVPIITSRANSNDKSRRLMIRFDVIRA